MKKLLFSIPILLLFLNSCVFVNDLVYSVVWEKRDKVILDQLSYNKEVAKKNITILDSLQSEINKKKIENPNTTANDLSVPISILKDSLQNLIADLSSYDNKKNLDFNSMIDYSNNITQKLNRLTEKNVIIETAINNTEDITLKSDISFETGSYSLKDGGKNALINIVNDIEKKIIALDGMINGNFKTYPKKINVMVTGYSDLQGSANIDVRKDKNFELSENRAKIVANNLKLEMNRLKLKYNVNIVVNSKGLGEDLPPNIADDKTIDNPKRRICLISTNVREIF